MKKRPLVSVFVALCVWLLHGFAVNVGCSGHDDGDQNGSSTSQASSMSAASSMAHATSGVSTGTSGGASGVTGSGGMTGMVDPSIKNAFNGQPDDLTKQRAAALQAGLSASEIDHLVNIDWSQETSYDFLNDKIMLHAIRILIQANLLALREMPRDDHSIFSVGIAYGHDCGDKAAQAVASALLNVKNGLAVLGAGFTATKCGGAALICFTSILAVTAGGSLYKELKQLGMDTYEACLNGCDFGQVWCDMMCVAQDENHCAACMPCKSYEECVSGACKPCGVGTTSSTTYMGMNCIPGSKCGSSLLCVNKQLEVSCDTCAASCTCKKNGVVIKTGIMADSCAVAYGQCGF